MAEYVVNPLSVLYNNAILQEQELINVGMLIHPPYLADAVIRFTMKPEQFDADADDSDATVKKDITDATAEGEYSITIAPEDTDLVEPGKYYYDVMCEFDDGRIFQVDSGTIKLTGTPTNRQD